MLIFVFFYEVRWGEVEGVGVGRFRLNDSSPPARYTAPGCGAVHHPSAEIALLAALNLFDLLGDQTPEC